MWLLEKIAGCSKPLSHEHASGREEHPVFNLWLSWVAWSWLSHVIKCQSQEFLPRVSDIVSSLTEQGMTALLEVMAYKTNYLTSLFLIL